MALKNYVLGRGQIFLAELDADQNPGNFRYVGNTTEFNVSVETETLDHTNPDEGINEVDASVQTSVTRSGTLIMDDIQRENLALFLFGSVEALNVGADAADQTLNLTADQLAAIKAQSEDKVWFPLGVSAGNPIGIRNLDAASFAIAGLVLNTDYNVDLKRGRIRFLNTDDARNAAGPLEVTYRKLADNTRQIRSGNTPKSVCIKFFENNADGTNNDWTFPFCDISPNGALPLKANEWRNIPFNLSINQPRASGVAAIYVNEIPA